LQISNILSEVIYSTFLYLKEVLHKQLNNCSYLILSFSAVAQQTFQEIVTTFNSTACVTQNIEITAANNCSILMIIKRNMYILLGIFKQILMVGGYSKISLVIMMYFLHQ